MKKIKIKFVDFWKNFDYKKSIIYDCLKDNYEIEISDNPDYLFYSVFGNENLNYDCVKIFYTGENETPDFNLCDYGIGFDYIDFGDRYIRFPIYYEKNSWEDFNKMINKPKLTIDDINKKENFCTFVYSNGKASKERTLFFDELSKYKKVLSGGGYMNNIGYRVSDKIKFLETSKFSFAFENSSHLGYTTEKIIQSFAANTIPIYWGDPNISNVFNPKAFINVNNFSSFEEAIKYIKEIDNDDNKYLEIINENPIINCQSIDEKYIELKRFLSNIFDQQLSDAYRRDTGYHGKLYLNKMRNWYNKNNKGPKIILEKIKDKIRSYKYEKRN